MADGFQAAAGWVGVVRICSNTGLPALTSSPDEVRQNVAETDYISLCDISNQLKDAPDQL